MTSSLEQASAFAAMLDDEVRRQSAILDALRAHTAEQQQLAAIASDHAQALLRSVETAIKREHQRHSRSRRREQLLFLILGVVLSLPAQWIINWLAL